MSNTTARRMRLSRPTAPARDHTTALGDLAAAEARIATLRGDPDFLTPRSAVVREHDLLSRQAAVLRAELAALGRRPMIAHGR